MDPAAADVLTRLPGKLPVGWSAADTNVRDGTVTITSGDADLTLTFDERAVLDALEHADADGEQLWGAEVPPAETLARLMSVHLEAFLATTSPTPPRCTWDGGFRGDFR